jgi:hypothetical protein
LKSKSYFYRLAVSLHTEKFLPVKTFINATTDAYEERIKYHTELNIPALLWNFAKIPPTMPEK